MSQGWICPKCGNVYAPFQFECIRCNNIQIKTDDCGTNCKNEPKINISEKLYREIKKKQKQLNPEYKKCPRCSIGKLKESNNTQCDVCGFDSACLLD